MGSDEPMTTFITVTIGSSSVVVSLVVLVPWFFPMAVSAAVMASGVVPVCWIRPDDLRVVQWRAIVKVHGDGRRRQQDVDREVQRGGARHPGRAFLVVVLVRSMAVVYLVTRVINVVVLLDPRRGSHRSRSITVSTLRSLRVADTSRQGEKERRASHQSDTAGFTAGK